MTKDQTLALLQHFCSKEAWRPNLQAPFSRGEHTYACNGHIAIRVPRLQEVADSPNAPNIEERFFTCFTEAVGVMRRYDISQIPAEIVEQEACRECAGRGVMHECDDCRCTCENCHGNGNETSSSYDIVSCEVEGCFLSPRYLKQILALPGAKFGRSQNAQGPQPFSFDGGDGLVMPLQSGRWENVVMTPIPDVEQAGA